MQAAVRRRLLLCLTLAATIIAALPARADLGAVVGSYGRWELRRSTDRLTDRVMCLATYKTDPGIQLNKNALYIKTSRVPRAFRYRLDEQPVSQMTPVPEILRKLHAVGIEGAGFGQVVKARRLRIQVLTRNAMQEFDLDLDGIASAYGAVYWCR